MNNHSFRITTNGKKFRIERVHVVRYGDCLVQWLPFSGDVAHKTYGTLDEAERVLAAILESETRQASDEEWEPVE